MPANTIRLLIAGSQAGSLIGISGQNIEKLRNSCGATITVLAQNQLSLCASAHESDRVVQVSLCTASMLKELKLMLLVSGIVGYVLLLVFYNYFTFITLSNMRNGIFFA